MFQPLLNEAQNRPSTRRFRFRADRQCTPLPQRGDNALEVGAGGLEAVEDFLAGEVVHHGFEEWGAY